MSSLRLVPANTTKSASVQDTKGPFGLHDTLQYGPRSLAVEIKSQGTLKDRLENVCRDARLNCPLSSHHHQWEETQDNLKLNLQRNVHGMHLPMRVLMERKLVASVRSPRYLSEAVSHSPISNLTSWARSWAPRTYT